MAEEILLDEFHLSVLVSRDLDAAATRALRRTLDSVRFQSRLMQAILAVLRRYRTLQPARVTLTR